MEGGSNRSTDKRWRQFRLPSSTLPCRRMFIVRRNIAVYFDHQNPNSWPAHQHPYVQITVFLDGTEGRLSWRAPDGHEIEEPVRGAHVWIVPPNVRHSASASKVADIIALYVRAELIREIPSCPPDHVSLMSLSRYVREDPLIAELVATFRAFCRQKDLAAPKHVELTGSLLAYRLMAAHFAPRNRELSDRPSLPEATLENLTQFIRKSYREKINRTILARRAGLSPWYFTRLFKNSTGVTPTQYLINYRLEQAKALLIGGDYTVTWIAQEVGFSDDNEMTNHFKKRYGATPRDFLPKRKR